MGKTEKKDNSNRKEKTAPAKKHHDIRPGIRGDKQVFQAIQIQRYLKRKVQKRFCSAVEKDVIEHIIGDSWEDMLPEIPEHFDQTQRISLYCNCVIVFPYFVVEEESIIPVDFRLKRTAYEKSWNRPSSNPSGKSIGPF